MYFLLCIYIYMQIYMWERRKYINVSMYLYNINTDWLYLFKLSHFTMTLKINILINISLQNQVLWIAFPKAQESKNFINEASMPSESRTLVSIYSPFPSESPQLRFVLESSKVNWHSCVLHNFWQSPYHSTEEP